MCGIVGMMGELTFKHKDVMGDLLYMDTLRGEDSTGISVIRPNGDVETLKLAVPGYDFIKYARFRELLKVSDNVWLGHNRYKTTGAVNRINAHPFEVTDDDGFVALIGAHNGTLINKHDIPDNRAYETDSEALFNYISDVGIKEAISKVRGAWSLVWIDCLEDTVNFLRNDERPMCFTFTKDRKSIIWASESWMIRAACARRGLDIELIQFPKEDTWIKFPIPGIKDPKVLPDPVAEGAVEGLPPRPTFQKETYGGYGGGWPVNNPHADRERWHRPVQEKQTSNKEGSTTGGKTEPVILLPGEARGYEGKAISEDKLKTCAVLGCGWCGDGIDLRDSFAFLDDDNMCCSNCLRDKHALEDPEDGEEETVETKSNVIELSPLLNDVQRKVLQDFAEKKKGDLKRDTSAGL